ncbi:MAG: acyltransferase [Deltaproteobacteria bacterium]|nr:acyltransferase [Deltaproteobacteria bacterium]
MNSPGTRVVRAALTQTKNAFDQMPSEVDSLESRLARRLDELREANLVHHERLIRKAHARGARLIGLGELFTAPYFALESRLFWVGLAEDGLEGPTARRMRALSAELGSVIVAPIFELDPSGKRFNAAIVLDSGVHLGGYRKTHIPCGGNERGRFVETDYYGPGDGGLTARGGDHGGARIVGRNAFFPVFETSVGRVGVAICYDRHFEGVMKSLAAGGAEIVLSPAVTFGDKSRRMWDLEFPVDAARHNLFIGGSNRLGVEPPWTIEYFGSSYFAGPSGKCLEDLSDDPHLVISDLDLDQRKFDSSGWDLPRDTRPEIYSR